MKNILLTVSLVLLLGVALAGGQGMMGPGMMGGQSVTAEEISHTKQEEKEGLDIWEKLSNGEVGCDDLTDEQFELMGEYFMGQMIGDAHASMNKMMEQRMGKEGEEQMHITLGKRYSGCYKNTTTEYEPGIRPNGMMNGGYYNGLGMMGCGMMGGYGFWSPWNLIWMAFWVLALIALILLTIWMYKKITGKSVGENPLEILKVRYAKGELTKKQYEEMKKKLDGG